MNEQIEAVRQVTEHAITHVSRAPIVANKNKDAVNKVCRLLNDIIANSPDQPLLIEVCINVSIELQNALEQGLENMADLVQDIGNMETAHRQLLESVIIGLADGK